ncbi:unnamed protein product [Symbiodinium microadriaticum]|nr:unnamed protein product [Symbiodinium microadriaticum]
MAPKKRRHLSDAKLQTKKSKVGEELMQIVAEDEGLRQRRLIDEIVAELENQPAKLQACHIAVMSDMFLSGGGQARSELDRFHSGIKFVNKLPKSFILPWLRELSEMFLPTSAWTVFGKKDSKVHLQLLCYACEIELSDKIGYHDKVKWKGLMEDRYRECGSKLSSLQVDAEGKIDWETSGSYALRPAIPDDNADPAKHRFTHVACGQDEVALPRSLEACMKLSLVKFFTAHEKFQARLSKSFLDVDDMEEPTPTKSSSAVSVLHNSATGEDVILEPSAGDGARVFWSCKSLHLEAFGKDCPRTPHQWYQNWWTWWEKAIASQRWPSDCHVRRAKAQKSKSNSTVNTETRIFPEPSLSSLAFAFLLPRWCQTSANQKKYVETASTWNAFLQGLLLRTFGSTTVTARFVLDPDAVCSPGLPAEGLHPVAVVIERGVVQCSTLDERCFALC